jgi:hypothetical protein
MTTVRLQDVVYNSYIGYDYSLSLDGKLGANLQNTPILATLPTTSTASIGTYLFKNGPDSVILNASGKSPGAIQLVCVDGVNNPKTYLSASSNGVAVSSLSATSPDASGNVYTSTLNGSQLLFGKTDYKSLVDTHTRQIAGLSAVDVTELAKLSDLDAVDQTLKNRLNVIEAKQPLIISIPIYHVPAVYADSTGRADYIPASVSAVTSYSGLYYKNNLNEKINWYIPPDNNLTVGDIKAFMLNFYNVSAVTGLGCPFVAVYTKTDTVTPNAASWYKSRKTFSVNYTSTTTINTSYALLADLKGLTYDPSAYGHTKVNASTIPGNDKGSFADSEQILFFSIGTSSNSVAGLFEFIASKFTILTASASNEFVFQKL